MEEESQAPLQELLQRVRPDAERLRRWAEALADRATALDFAPGGGGGAGGATGAGGSLAPGVRTGWQVRASLGSGCSRPARGRHAIPRGEAAASAESTPRPSQAASPKRGVVIGRASSPAASGEEDSAADGGATGVGRPQGAPGGAVKALEAAAPGERLLRLPKATCGCSVVPGHKGARRLPSRVVWAITLLIPLLVATANNLIVWSDGVLLSWKFDATQVVMAEGGPFLGAFVLAAICVAFCAAAACLVVLAAPVCGGSGLPEAKGFLNGNRVRGIFKVRVVLVRIFGIIMATAAGFPIGREGPMVAIGGSLGYGVAHFLAYPWARQWVSVDANSDAEGRSSSPALIVDEERFVHTKRVGFILGGAAGIATAFDAPIGGILYMFEEATMTTWPPELTFRAVVCSVCAALLSRAWFNLAGQDVHRLLIYVEERADRGSWDWPDVPFFVLLAATVGLLSALFTRVLVAVWSCRQARARRLQRWQPFAKILDCVLYAAICAIVFALSPLLISCVDDGSAEVKDETPAIQEFHHAIFDMAHSLKYVRHACPAGQVNEVATLLLKGCEGTVKYLFSRDVDFLTGKALALGLGVYTTLAAGMAGLPVPMGNFLPSMLIGALAGRLAGEAVAGGLLDDVLGHLGKRLADPGVYALVGAAAMLSGFTHMTIAVVVILVEAAHDLSLISPLMLSIFISHLVSTCVNSHSYDEALIIQKGVPFLDAELPREMDRHGLVASDLCEALPDAAVLPPEPAVAAVRRALDSYEGASFPVVEDGLCVGLIPRPRLEAAMRARGASPSKEGAGPGPAAGDAGAAAAPQGWGSGLVLASEEEEEDLDLDDLFAAPGGGGRGPGGAGLPAAPWDEESPLPVHYIMDSSPYMLQEDMPAPRLYPLFTRAGTTAACVVSKTGEFRGLLTRVHLISAASHALRPAKAASGRGRRYTPL